LISIDKTWGNFRGPEAIRLGEVLSALISRNAQGGVAVAIVTTRSGREPQIAGQGIDLTFGNITLSLVVIEHSSEAGRVVVVNESLSQRPPR